ncbi:endonuclease III [Vampirovibrio sp.]|uniref:endonuclease III domain-containing protein n=1 Tax=Vampirovibrio sp. TaxID=2717857 RepID=UPI0035944A4D
MPKVPVQPASKRPVKSSAAVKAPVSKKQKNAAAMDNTTMCQVLEILANTYDFHPMGELTQHDPYKVLVACVLSLRTKDEVTMPASERLFAHADTPAKMVTLPVAQVAELIYPVGFYKTKAQSIVDFSQKLLDDFGGEVPNTIDELLTLKGVGRKTANLVVGLGHQLPAICVDIHVHRICNRMGYIQTKTPDESEMTLREILPLPYWNVINTMMVLHGQQICRPIGPHCDRCPVASLCPKVNVKPRTLKPLRPKPYPPNPLIP